MKPNIVPNCIRSESYMITFEVEEEKYECNLNPVIYIFFKHEESHQVIDFDFAVLIGFQVPILWKEVPIEICERYVH